MLNDFKKYTFSTSIERNMIFLLQSINAVNDNIKSSLVFFSIMVSIENIDN